MKINKIIKIKGYKSFQDFTWQPFLNNETFHDEVNIFYGENGSGKSSICNILKNILVGNNLLNNKFGYKSFGKHEPKEVCIKFDIGECVYSRIAPNETGFTEQANLDRAFSGNWWDQKLTSNDSILFFDREFVAKNVHEYERKTTKEGQEQQSGKLIIEFDAEAINLRDGRDKAKISKEEDEQKIKDFNEANKDLLAFTLNEQEKIFFQKYIIKTEEEISNTKQEFSKELETSKKNLEVDLGMKKVVSNIQGNIKDLPKFEIKLGLSNCETYQAVFNFDIKEQVKIVAETELIQKIKTNKSFFDIGIEIRKSHPDKCPFCQTRKEEDEIKKIITLYNDIYDVTYKTQTQQFEVAKQALISELQQIANTISCLDLNLVFLELKKLEQNYKIPNIYFVGDEEKFKKPLFDEIDRLRGEISKLIKPNKENILESYSKVENEFNAIINFLSDVDNFIDQKNDLLVKFRSDNTDEKLQSRIASYTTNIESIESELSFIVGGKILMQKQQENKMVELNALQGVSATSKTEYESSLKTYEKYCSTNAFSNLLSKIEDYFIKFNFSFKLELKTDPTGNKTEFPFAFKVLDFEGNERDFKDGLSEGEIQVLSLCFFFAFLDIQKNKKQKILVFDDPITSLDNSNLSSLVDLIAEEQSKFSQTFIFSHHRTFFKFLRKRFDKHCNEYNLIRNKKEFGGSFICKSRADKFLDKLRSFEADLAKIPPASLDVELKVVEYGQYLRYEVERYIKNTLLHWDADRDFTLAIEGVKTNKLITDDDLNKIKGVYSFCNWTTSHVDVGDDHGLTQLKGKIAEFVAIVK